MKAQSISGVGVGFRVPHFADIMQQRPALGWFEVLADNYLTDSAIGHRQLSELCSAYPIALHCVGMSLGSVDPLDFDYLQRVKSLALRYQSAWVSDHLCFVSVDGAYFHDLLPLPYTEEAVQHVAARVRQVQDYLGQRILLENVSSYIRYQSSEMSETEFLNAVADEADCRILLDLNNLYVSACNHGDDAGVLLDEIQLARVEQIHLGGFELRDGCLVDTHSRPPCEQVWDLFTDFVRRKPAVPTLIEWDNDLPDFPTLLVQAERAQAYFSSFGARVPASAPVREGAANK